ncbi:MAG: histidine--tRNA ligase [Kineosporiaceae bacterium]|nr:histidine--tRNA ligase [Kineosporiaceae bacterium]
MARPAPLSGFPEWLPPQRMVEQQVIDSLRRTFESWGFAPIETRAAEPLAELLRKGEIDKEVYVLRRLHADENEGGEGAEAAHAEAKRLGLHFDLTVPFARYVLENSGKLQFPFRRYQIQKVWRGERPQEGRYREFCQADVDIVGAGSLPFHHDVEIAQVMTEALAALPVPPLTLQVNNRRLIEGFYLGLGAQDVPAVMRAVDKLDKIGPDGVRDLLRAVGLSAAESQACLDLAEICTPDSSFAERVGALGVKHDLLDQGIAELVAVIDGAAALATERVRIHADLRIARGLDYYTGTVYETRMASLEHLGSVCSGGRYESLASDGSTTYPGVGISFGLTRTLGPLFARGQLTASRSVPTCVLVALTDEGSRVAAGRVAAALRRRGIAAEVAPSADKFGKQIRYADRRGIPYVWFPAAGVGDAPSADISSGSVKDIRSGEQVDADPATWQPPAADLNPRIISAD